MSKINRNSENNIEVNETSQKQEILFTFKENKEVISMKALDEPDDKGLGKPRLVQYKGDNQFYRLRFLPIKRSEMGLFEKKIKELMRLKLSHDSLLPITDYFLFQDKLGATYLVTEEEYQGVPLSIYRKDKILSPIQLLCFLCDVFAALKYLHSKKITHFCLNEHTILIKDGKAYVSTYWLSTLLNPIPVLETHLISKENAPLVGPELWKGFMLSTMSHETYEALYKVDNFAIVSLFYALYTKNDINLNSKTMFGKKVFEWGKLYPKSSVVWFDKLMLEVITSTYKSRVDSKAILSCLKNVKGKEIELIKESFDINHNCLDEFLVVLIGKKLPKEYENVKNIDFGKGIASSLEDQLDIQAFVEASPNVEFTLLNIDDANRLDVLMNIIRSFSYLPSLVEENKNKKVLILSCFQQTHNEFLVMHVKEQLNICKRYGNALYISPAGDEGLDYKNKEITGNSRFSHSFLHDIKLTIGSLNGGHISKSSNRGACVNYFVYGEDSTLIAGCRTVLLTTLLWSHYPDLNAMDILEKLKEYSVQDDNQSIRKLDHQHILSLTEIEWFQHFALKTILKKGEKCGHVKLKGTNKNEQNDIKTLEMPKDKMPLKKNKFLLFEQEKSNVMAVLQDSFANTKSL